MKANKILKNFSYLSIVQTLNYALPIITIPLVSRALGVEKIGLISYVYSYLIYLILFINYSFSLTAIRKQNEINNLNYVFSLVFKSQIFLLIFTIPFLILSLLFMPDLKQNRLLTCISYIAVIGAFFDKNWVYQYKQNLSLVAVVNVVLKLLSILLIILFIKEQKDYLVYAVILYSSALLTNLLLFLMCIRKYEIKIVKIKIQHVLDFLKEGKMLFLSSVVISLYTSTSTLLLGLYCNNRDVGLYTAASKLVDIAKVFAIMPITQLIYPIVTQKISSNVEEGVLFVKKLMPIFNLMAVLLFFGAIIVGPFILYLLFGAQFLDAIPILCVLSFTLVLILYSTVFGILLMVNLGMDHLFFKNQLYVAIFSILLTILVLPYGAGMTSAIILVASEIMITAYQYYCLKSKGYQLFNLDMLTKKAFLDAVKAIKIH
ncbi:oligosaccharide flippase family protein [Acinetobacter johnsonii]|uniref:oligosaccharide flippase family protein n=1 Tax=Acinetobacter johnsonii TaxID=40214 RepID=UPI002448739A|nr:oligosaccharide flippase family protein [Acinetobacter johnsonii]MDH0834300.1 oligosaccharide flippase family protein [Acinetobacter johnsonii]MDH0838261.1 oligosaccharide flippase family protein [Acinetobacter johnsonii]